MSPPVSDPDDRVLRGEISGAVRARNPELADELRHELRLRNVERAFRQQLDGVRLTGIELRRLRRALEQYGPSSIRPAEQTEDDAAVAV